MESQFIKQVVDASPIILYIYDLIDQRNVYANKPIAQIVGYSPEQIQSMGKNFLERVIHPEDLPRVRKHLEIEIPAAKEGETLKIEYRFQHANGEWRHLESQNSIFCRADDGTVKQIIGVVQDISQQQAALRDRKQAAQKLQETEQFFQRVAEAIPGWLYIYDLNENRNIYTNNQAGEILGFSPLEIEQMGSEFLPSIIHPDDLVKVPKNLQKIARLEDGELLAWECRLRNSVGEWRWFLLRETIFLRNQDETPKQILGTAIDIHDSRKASLEGLCQSEEKFKNLAENIDSAFWIVDADSSQTNYVSPSYEVIWKRSCEELYNNPQSYLDAIHPEDRSRIISCLYKQAAGEYDEEYRIVHPDGSIAWIRARAFPIRDRGGKIYCIAHLAEDISDRILAEDTLKESEKRLQNLVNTLCDSEARLQTIVTNLLDGLLILNRRGQVLFANPAAGKIFGYHPQELIGVELGWPNIKQDTIEITILRPGGEIGVGEMHLAPAHWEGKSVWIISVRDITARKQAEDALRESEERFRQLAENIADVFWLTCPKANQLLYVSPAYEQIWGRPIADAYNQQQTWLDNIYPDDHPAVFTALTKQIQGESTSLEYRIVRPDGTIRWIWARGFPIKDQSGHLSRIAGIAEDISDRKTAEAQIQASLQEKEVLLKEIHHRVKNNMQVISSLLELQSQYIVDPNTISLFRESQSRIHSMALIHEQLYQSLPLEEIDFARYIEDLATNLFQFFGNHSNAIELKLNIARISLNIETAIPCGLIINELLSNSLKYAFPQANPGEIRINFERINEGQFHLSVSDNGVGLPPHFNLNNLETLGMRLVQMLTRQLKGTLEISSESGTEFKIAFSELNYSRRV